MSKFKVILGSAVLVVLLHACVTVNITFPPAAAEAAADKFIEQVWQEKQNDAPPLEDKAPDGEDEQSALPDNSSPPLAQTGDRGDFQSAVVDKSPPAPLFQRGGMVDFLIPAAHAAADFNISTPAIKNIKDRMAGRHKKLVKHYDSGAVGLSNDALIAVRDAKLAPLRDRSMIKREVAAENKDRLALYQEIANANGHPEWVNEIRATFAGRWIKKARPGWWYQDKSGKWVQKK